MAISPTLEQERIRALTDKKSIYLRLDDINPAHARFSLFINGGLCCSPSDICVRLSELDDLTEVWRGGWRVLDDRTARSAQEFATSWAIRVGIGGES